MKHGLIKKFLACAATLTLVAGLTACGSDTTPIPQGQVVKGPVFGATVKDANGHVIGTTDHSGKFPLYGVGPYTVTGGTYFPLKADGTYSNVALNAPPMSAPAGVTQVTPLSTLVANAATPAEAAAIMTTLQNMGITNLNSDLSVKTTANASAWILSETIGAVLTQAVSSGATTTEVGNIMSAINTALATANAGTLTTAAQINAMVQTQLTATLGTTDPTLATALSSASTTISTGAGTVVPGTIPPIPTTETPVTGATGGTSGGTTI